MLYLKYCSDWKQNMDQAVSEVCAFEYKPAKRILIVPEQNSFDTEWAVCEKGGCTVSRFVEVLSFSRLTTRVFSQTGGVAIRSLDRTGRLIAMASALEKLQSKLKLFAGRSSKPDFLQKLVRTVDEFRSCGLRIEDVRNAEEQLNDQLAAKLEELCLIMETYDGVCSGAIQDPASRLDRLRDAIYDSEYGRNTQIVVSGFSDFTAQEISVLEALLVHAEQMTVYLTCDSLTSGQSVFSVPRKTAATLRNLAKKHGILFRAVPVLGAVEQTELQHVRDALFAPKAESWPDLTENIALCTAHSAQEECLSALGWIQRRLLSGARLRDIAIVNTNGNLYGPMLENLLSRFELPAYFAGSRELLRHPVIRGVLFALEAAATGMQAESISEYLKSGFAPIDADEADLLENYGYIWKLRGSGWEKPFERNPDGIQKDEAVDQQAVQQKLQRLNLSRETAIGPLAELRRGLQEASNTAEQVEALDRFLRRIGIGKMLDERTEQLAARGDIQKAQEWSQLYELLLTTMEQIYGVLGRSVRSPEDFYLLLRAALAQASVGTVPASLDSIHVGELSTVRNLRVKHLLILGASDGLLPGAVSTASLLSDSDRRSMKLAGLPVVPDDSERMDRELLLAFTAFSAPEQSLYVSCQADKPSFLFTRLTRLFPHAASGPYTPMPVSEEQAAGLLAEQAGPERDALLADLPALRSRTEALLDRAAYAPGSLAHDAVEALYGKQLSLNSSKIDRFAACRYAYYLRYGINVKDQQPARADASLYGVFVHDVLQRTVEAVQHEGGFRNVTLEHTLEISEQFCNRFVDERLQGFELWTQRGAYLFRRNFREVFEIVRDLYAEMSQSEFIPTSFELAFENATAIPITGKIVCGSLRGVVDRVDLYTTASGKTYLRVIDYKTGRKDFDYTDLLEGEGLQMLIYLFALTREAEQFYQKPLEPAGVLYFPARYDVETTKGRPTTEEAEKKHRDALRRKGLILDDEEILHAMEPGDDPIYLPFKFHKKDGSRSGNLVDEDRFRCIERYVFRSLGRMADEIAEGRIDANPYWRGEDQNACRWCEYREICHVDSGEIPMRRRKAVSADQFWKTLEEEDPNNGNG